MKRLARIFLLAALALPAVPAGAQDASAYKLIVNASNPVTQITPSEGRRNLPEEDCRGGRTATR